MTCFLKRLEKLSLVGLAILALLGFLAVSFVLAQEPAPLTMQKSPLHDVAPSERPVLASLGPRNVRLRHITTSPAAINGSPNDILRATYGGNERLCVATGAGPTPTTTWSCVTLSAP